MAKFQYCDLICDLTYREGFEQKKVGDPVHDFFSLHNLVSDLVVNLVCDFFDSKPRRRTGRSNGIWALKTRNNARRQCIYLQFS